MAAIDFPASPTTGQTFSAPNGVIYMYDGVKWTVAFAPSGMVAFKTGVAVGQAVAQWTDYKASFNTPEFNNGGGLWNGSDYTVKTAGLYDIFWNCSISWPSVGALYNGQQYANFWKNGAFFIGVVGNPAINGGPEQNILLQRWLGYLAVNDVIAFHFSFGNTNATFDAGSSWASIIRLGS